MYVQKKYHGSSSEVKSKQGIKIAYNFSPQMTNFCLPQPSFVPVKNNLKKDGTIYAVQCIEPS